MILRGRHKMLVTGSNGCIGQTGLVLVEGDRLLYSDNNVLTNPRSVHVDVARDYDNLKVAMHGMDTVLHLAWDSRENWRSGIAIPENKIGAENVYRAAKEAGLRRVIMASSIHADNWQGWKHGILMDPYMAPQPVSEYGATKVYIEALGRVWAKRGLEVVCLRLGGVSRKNIIRSEEGYRKIFLSISDCGQLIQHALDASVIPDNYCIVYGVSNNPDRIHDISNPLGWTPKQAVEDFEPPVR